MWLNWIFLHCNSLNHNQDQILVESLDGRIKQLLSSTWSLFSRANICFLKMHHCSNVQENNGITKLYPNAHLITQVSPTTSTSTGMTMFWPVLLILIKMWFEDGVPWLKILEISISHVSGGECVLHFGWFFQYCLPFHLFTLYYIYLTLLIAF